MMKKLLTITLLLGAGMLQAQTQVNERARWFVDARYGMFIHWGIYSGAEGYWKGEKLRNDNDYAEWLFYRNRISKEEYLTLLDRFDWESIDPEQWVLLAKKAGMKYVTITAKHHDGFALWDSKVTDYDIADHTNPRRDIIKELAAACKKHGLKLGLYYSHWVDWEHLYGWDHTKEIYKITPEQYDKYWQEKVMPQMRELLTSYGPIGIIWFDMWINHRQSIVTQKQLEQLKGLIRELQPQCLVNSRLGLSLEEDSDIDFRTLGDNQLGQKKLDYPWQSPATVAHSWGYHATDMQWKSTTTLLKSLINNVSLNGNFMLNIGPRANGDVPAEISQRLLESGQWLDINGEAIYGSGAFDLDRNAHDWGLITHKALPDGRHRLYLHVFNWPLSHRLPLTGVTSAPGKVYLLQDKSKAQLLFTHQGPFTEIALPHQQPDPRVSVVVLEYDTKPQVTRDLVAKRSNGGFNMNPINATDTQGSFSPAGPERYGTVPYHIDVDGAYRATWQIYMDKPGKKWVDVSYSYQGKKPSESMTVTAANQKLMHRITPTGLTVGEPNRQWHIDNFASHRLGQIEVSKPGVYQVTLEINPGDDPVKFQWLWVEDE